MLDPIIFIVIQACAFLEVRVIVHGLRCHVLSEIQFLKQITLFLIEIQWICPTEEGRGGSCAPTLELPRVKKLKYFYMKHNDSELAVMLIVDELDSSSRPIPLRIHFISNRNPPKTYHRGGGGAGPYLLESYDSIALSSPQGCWNSPTVSHFRPSILSPF